MKITFPRMMVVLSSLFCLVRMEAAPSPTPTPTPVAPPISQELAALHDKLAGMLSGPALAWANDEADKAATNPKLTEGNIRADIQTRFTGQSLEEQDKAILFFVVLEGATKTMGDKLAAMVGDFQKKARDSTQGPGGNTTINLSPVDMGNLQEAMARRTQFMATMTTLGKKVSNAQSSVVGNLH